MLLASCERNGDEVRQKLERCIVQLAAVCCSSRWQSRFVYHSHDVCLVTQLLLTNVSFEDGHETFKRNNDDTCTSRYRDKTDMLASIGNQVDSAVIDFVWLLYSMKFVWCKCCCIIQALFVYLDILPLAIWYTVKVESIMHCVKCSKMVMLQFSV